jgi:hypothetical protein
MRNNNILESGLMQDKRKTRRSSEDIFIVPSYSHLPVGIQMAWALLSIKQAEASTNIIFHGYTKIFLGKKVRFIYLYRN